MTVIVHGWDVSLNHAAFVELHDGELADFWYVTDKAGSAARSKDHGHRLKINDKAERAVKSLERLAWMEHFIDKQILMKRRPHYVGLEDYAIRMEQQSHYLGEIGGIARILCWFRGVKLRLHDPTSVKMWAAHNGNAQKDIIEMAVQDRWGADFSEYNQPPPKRADQKQNRQTSEDLADAFAIAQLVWAEVQLRAGEVQLRNFHPKEIQVFNRVTKTYPVNLLDRDWIVNPDGKDTPHGDPVCPRCGSSKCCLAKRRKMIK